MKRKRMGGALFFICVLFILMTGIHAQYYPNMQYGEKTELYPGITWQVLTNASPSWNIHVFEIDMTNPGVRVVPGFKIQGNLIGSGTERTSSIAGRMGGLAAINAGYGVWGPTNSYTLIDGEFIGGSGTTMRPENNRSVLGFSAHRQEIAVRTKLSNTTVPADPEHWDDIVDAIAGRGHFVAEDGVMVVQDNESTTEAHHGSRHPRTAMGFSEDPYIVYLVTVDGRSAGGSVGMTYTELGRLMADLGAEQSVSLDGGGSTTAWVSGEGVVNVPSDEGNVERGTASAWIVLPEYIIDHTDDECTVTGSWDISEEEGSYYLNSLVAQGGDESMKVTWTPAITKEGRYAVAVRYAPVENPCLVYWDFDDLDPDDPNVALLPAGGIDANLAEEITVVGANFRDLSTGRGGYQAAYANDWVDGSGTKYWTTQFSTKGYTGITVSSHQSGSGTGPRDFRLEYKVGETGSWTAVSGGTIRVENDWLTGVLNDVALPAAADDQDEVHLRWIMTSNLNIRQDVTNEQVGASGTNRLDNVIIRGTTTTDRTSEAQYIISHRDGEAEVFLDQQAGGGEWQELGAYYFSAGSNGSVQLVNTAGAAETISADAARFFYVGDPPDPLEDMIIDNLDTGYVEIVGAWQTGAFGTPWGENYHLNWGGGTGSQTFSWFMGMPESGIYEVFAWWVAGGNRNDNVEYFITHAEGQSTVYRNQQQNDARWVSLGEYTFMKGQEGRITVTDKGEGVIIADAVKFELIESFNDVTFSGTWQLYE